MMMRRGFCGSLGRIAVETADYTDLLIY